MIDDNWLLGFIEGEGYFGILISKETHKMRVRATFQIQLSLEDAHILYEIQKQWGIGSVKSYPPRNQSSAGVTQLTARSKKDVKKIIDILDKLNWHTKKQVDYLKWKMIFKLTENNTYLDESTFKRVMQIYESMNGGSKSTRKDWLGVTK